LKLQIRSAMALSQFHRKFVCTGTCEVPCSLGRMRLSSPGTQGSSHNFGDDVPNQDAPKAAATSRISATRKLNFIVSEGRVARRREFTRYRRSVCSQSRLQVRVYGSGTSLMGLLYYWPLIDLQNQSSVHLRLSSGGKHAL